MYGWIILIVGLLILSYWYYQIWLRNVNEQVKGRKNWYLERLPFTMRTHSLHEKSSRSGNDVRTVDQNDLEADFESVEIITRKKSLPNTDMK